MNDQSKVTTPFWDLERFNVRWCKESRKLHFLMYANEFGVSNQNILAAKLLLNEQTNQTVIPENNTEKVDVLI